MNIQRSRDLREDCDYTQEYIAKLLNVNQRTYSRYENGAHAIPLTILSFLQTPKKSSPKNEYSYLLLIAACAEYTLHGVTLTLICSAQLYCRCHS